jgi:hypothetical protein
LAPDQAQLSISYKKEKDGHLEMRALPINQPTSFWRRMFSLFTFSHEPGLNLMKDEAQRTAYLNAKKDLASIQKANFGSGVHFCSKVSEINDVARQIDVNAPDLYSPHCCGVKF